MRTIPNELLTARHERSNFRPGKCGAPHFRSKVSGIRKNVPIMAI